VKRRRSLHLVFGALGVLVALVAVLGTWQVLAARNSQRSQIYRGELTAARFAGKAVSSAVGSRVQLLENLASQPQSAQLVGQGESASLQQTLSELILLYPEFSSMSVLSASGNLVAEVPAWPSTPALDQSRRASYGGVLLIGHGFVTGAFAQPTGGLAVTLGAPVRDPSGTFVGIVQATVPVSSLSADVGGTDLGGGANLVILDQEGHAITGPAASTATMRTFRSNFAVSEALRGRQGTSTSPVPGFSGDRLVAYVPIKSLHWVVEVENPVSTLDNPVGALTGRLVAIGAAVLLFAIAAAVGLWLLLRQLSRQRDEVAAIFSSVGEGVATLEADGTVVAVNPALENLTGRSTKDLVGKSWPDAFVVHDERGVAVDWELSVAAEAIRSRRVLASPHFSMTLTSADGRQLPVAITASPLFLDTAAPNGAVVVMRDVSREREVDQLKSSLVSTVSHELRTPLTLIQGFSELLLTRSNLDSVQSQAALTQIHASSQRLGRLIDDLLSVSRIESGRLNAELTAIDLGQVVSDVISSFSVDEGHRFTTDIAPDTGTVLADRDKILQVLTNLVSNAVKYSPTGSEVTVRARPVSNHAEVEVSDEGIGMSPSESEQVFEKFSRSNRPEVRKVGGTGLGLYITKNLVELQGGQLWMRSEPGRGSTFTFSVPLAHADNGGLHRTRDGESVTEPAADAEANSPESANGDRGRGSAASNPGPAGRHAS